MKKFFLLGLFVVVGLCATAQSCEAIVLPFFRYDTAAMSNYPVDKLMFRCYYSQQAFYESDTVPAGAEVFSIGQVREAYGSNYLSPSYVVDLSTLSYYAYNFREFQWQYPTGGTTICFSTPSSAHPYLVLRSLDETNYLAQLALDQYYKDRGL